MFLKKRLKEVLKRGCKQIVSPQDWKRLVFIPISKKGSAKECSNYRKIAFISGASKECSKFFKAGFNSMWTVNFQMFKLDLEKAEEPEIKLPTSVGSLKMRESSRKTSTSVLLTTLKPLLCGSQQTVENSSKDGTARPPDMSPEKSICRSRNSS